MRKKRENELKEVLIFLKKIARVNSELNQFWIECINSSWRNFPNSRDRYDTIIFNPIGKKFKYERKWIFENLVNYDAKLNPLLEVLPIDTNSIIKDINTAYEKYLSSLCDISNEERFKSYLINYCNWNKGKILKRGDILRSVNSGKLHEYLQISQITLILMDGIPASLFEFRCPVEEYLNEYGFCFLKTTESIEFVIQEICWDLRILNGGDLG